MNYDVKPRDLRVGVQDSKKIIPLRVYSDSRSLIDVICKDTGYPADKRVRIVVAHLRQAAQDPGVKFSWVDTKLQPADGLTKVGVERGHLLDILQFGKWSPEPTQATMAAKDSMRAARRAQAEQSGAKRQAARTYQ